MADKKLKYLVNYLLSERGEKGFILPEDNDELFTVYRSLVNIRPANKISEEYLKIEDEFLTDLNNKRGITDISQLVPVSEGLYLWHGDITTLKCGAIVNAANSGMTGCYRPCHNCIDNCIHTYAGVRLRLECSEIMEKQGFEEPTGKAKITSAYNLPAKYVIHTVGPVVSGRLNNEHCRLLESCYKSCLEAAVKNNVKSIAFCCISTGVFGFPKQEAAEIAVNTIKEFKKPRDIEVIFNVFTKQDLDIYRKLL